MPMHQTPYQLHIAVSMCSFAIYLKGVHGPLILELGIWHMPEVEQCLHPAATFCKKLAAYPDKCQSGAYESLR